MKTKTNMMYESSLCTEYDVICLTETWLDDTVYSSELFCDDFTVYRRDGVGRSRGAGVLVAIRNSVWRAELLSHEARDLDMIWLKLTNNNGFSFYLVTVYFSPRSKIESYLNFFEQFNTCPELFLHNICIVGDFNLPLITDSGFELIYAGPIYRELQYFLTCNALRLCNDIYNTNMRTLDLVITNIRGVVVGREVEILVPIDSHHPVLSINFHESHSKFRIVEQSEESYNFSKANFVNLYQSFANESWGSVLASDNVDNALKHFYDIIYTSFNQNVPKKKLTKPKYPVWYNQEIIYVIRRKEIFRRKFSNTKDERWLIRFKEYRSIFKRLIKRAYSDFVKNTEHFLKQEPKKFWNFVNCRRKNKSTSQDQFNFNGRKFGDGQSIASAFADYFGSVYRGSGQLDVAAALASPIMPGVQCLGATVITPRDVELAIKRLPSKQSFGPDYIPNYVVKGCSELLRDPLCHIFNLCLKNATFPHTWKLTKITPIFKKGMESDIENYRPVSILCTPAKVFEIILHNNIFPHIKHYISVNQHGFMPSRSISTNLVNFVNFTSGALDCRNQVDVVYTDFSKAFDSVNHQKLLSKFHYYGFSDTFINFFCSYLSDRRQYVSFRGYRSDSFIAGSGVPQGSNLGPLFFNLFINDLIFNIRSNVLMYADDLKIFRVIKNLTDCGAIQGDLDTLSKWCQENDLMLNVGKCCVMSIHRKKNPLICDYKINDTTLCRVNRFTDLGVLVTENLSFSSHILNTVQTAYKSLGFILRVGKQFREIETLKALFMSLVRSRLEFASIVWSPSMQLYCQIIERVQKRFLRALYFKSFAPFNFPIWNIRYEEMLNIFNVERLSKRRKLAQLYYLHGVMTGAVDDTITLSRINWCVPMYGGRAGRLLYANRARTAAHANSFFNNAINLFNSVADGVDVAMSTVEFRAACKRLVV